MKTINYTPPTSEAVEVYAEAVFCVSDSESTLETMGYEKIDWEE